VSQPRTRTALAVSTLLHAAVLGALVLTVRPPPLSSPLSVRFLKLSPVEALGPAARGAAGAAGPDVASASKPPVRREAPSGPAHAAAPRPLAALASEGAPSSSAPQPPAGPAATDTGASVPTGAAAGPLSLGGGGAGAGATGGDGRLSELHQRLAEAAVRCYPTAARRFRLQGEVPLHFCLDASGTATALRLQGSTGSPLLDRSALECVVPGAQPLSGFEGCFVVPVRFGG